MKIKVLSIILISLGLVACTQSKNDAKPNNQVTIKRIKLVPEDMDKVIKNLSQNVILATYKGLSDSAEELHQQVLVLEQNKTQANLDKAQALWKKSRLYWESTESFLFGPVDSLSIDPMIDTWPLNITDLTAILNNGAPITAEVIQTSGANLKGFHTIEFLLFGNGVVTNFKSINALTDRELEYLKATAEVLAQDTAKLTHAWTTQYDPDVVGTPPYISEIMNPGTGGIYSSPEAVIMQFLNGMIGIADEVGNGKLADPLGETLADADPTAEESPFSWNSITDFSNNIRSLRMMYLGHGGKNTGSDVGFKALIEKQDPELAQQIEAQIDLAIQKIQDISADGTPFGKAILDAQKRERVLTAQMEVNQLFALLEQRLLPALQ